MFNRSIFGTLVAAGIGTLIGIGLMTAAGLISAVRSGLPDAPEAEVLTVERLMAFCKGCGPDIPCDAATPVRTGYCRGFISGVMDSRPEVGRLCLPSDWNSDDALRLFLGWSSRHPEDKEIPASDGVMRAHAAMYGCGKAGGDI